MIDRLLNLFILLFLVFAFFVISFQLLTLFRVNNLFYETNETDYCLKWENKIVRQEAYKSYTPLIMGKMIVMRPVYHQAMDVEQRVCVEEKRMGE